MKIKKLLGGILFKITNKNEVFENNILNGKTIKTTKATVSKIKEVDTDWYNRLAQNSECIYEVGCNIGQTAVYALTNDNVKKILLVDPNPEALSVANKNLIHNNLIHKSQSFLGFVSNKIGEKLDFYTIGTGAAGSMYASHAETAAAIGSKI